MGDFLETIAFLVIFLAWLLRAILKPLMKKRQEEPQGPRPIAPQQEQRPQRTAAELLKELGLDLGEPEEVQEARGPSSSPPSSPGPMPSIPPPLARIPPTPRRKRKESGVRSTKVLLPSVELPTPPAAQPGARPVHALRDGLFRDLRGGPPSLRRAIVLAEVLGPPPGLRSADSAPRQ